MKISRVALIVFAGMIAASCSEKSAPDREKQPNTSEAPRTPGPEAEGEEELAPREEEIAEDCVAFVRSTRIVSAQTPSADCPGCPAEGAEVFSFRRMKTERISPEGNTCIVVVTLTASFNPGRGERIAGGLTAWIPPEQRTEYLNGKTPSDEQSYRVKITYQRRGEGWHPAEFDRADPE
jgi:hypothetical protein